MFFPEGQVRVFLYGEPVSMRLSFDGLYARTRHRMQQDPLSGDLFAFINRRATQIKVLYFDRTGLCVWSKRLEQGRLIGNWDWSRARVQAEPAHRRRRRVEPVLRRAEGAGRNHQRPPSGSRGLRLGRIRGHQREDQLPPGTTPRQLRDPQIRAAGKWLAYGVALG